MHAVHVLDRDEISLEVVTEEVVICVECEDLLVLELADNQVFHLLHGDLALIEKRLDLLHGSCLVLKVYLVFDHVETRRFEHTFRLLSLAQS